MVQEVEDFYGVYLLYCLNPKLKGRTYIGYTVNPNRRIKQHNTGAHAGGAYRTSGRGPWEMVLIIHGFPNDISGLRFEWAWQHPDKSRRLRNVGGKSRKETAFQFRWRIVCNMLRTPPWSGLCLTIRWLKQDFKLDFPSGLEPPLHMPIQFGPIVSKKITNKTKGAKTQKEPEEVTETQPAPIPPLIKCSVCRGIVKPDDVALACLLPRCDMKSHIVCLATYFLTDPKLILPIEGSCPKCDTTMLWGDLVRHRKGCYQDMSETVLRPDSSMASLGLDENFEDSDDDFG